MDTRLVTTILLVLILSSCSPVIQAPLPTETLQPTLQPKIEPTFTESPPTSTPKTENTSTLTPTSEMDPSMGTPVPDWKGLPVIPGANEGKPAGLGYIYSINITVEEAEMYYMEQMELGGWILSNRETSETGMFGGPTTILDFQRDKEAVNIMLVFSAGENYTMVVLTQI